MISDICQVDLSWLQSPLIVIGALFGMAAIIKAVGAIMGK